MLNVGLITAAISKGYGKRRIFIRHLTSMANQKQKKSMCYVHLAWGIQFTQQIQVIFLIMVNVTVHFDIILLDGSSVNLHTKCWKLMETDREEWDSGIGASGDPFLSAGVAEPALEEELCSKPFQFLLENKRKKYISSTSLLILSDGGGGCLGCTTRCYSCWTGPWAARSVLPGCNQGNMCKKSF